MIRLNQPHAERLNRAIVERLGVKPEHVVDGFNISTDVVTIGGHRRVLVTWEGNAVLSEDDFERIFNDAVHWQPNPRPDDSPRGRLDETYRP